ncbi:MAG: hypothetical protein FJW20_02335 [Acidimicrobiia bacterium]|nr:hypothetical protein [Acidimicrobiia bacterium]
MSAPLDLGHLLTEQRNPATLEIDTLSTLEMCRLINQQDQQVAEAAGRVLPQIAAAIDATAQALEAGASPQQLHRQVDARRQQRKHYHNGDHHLPVRSRTFIQVHLRVASALFHFRHQHLHLFVSLSPCSGAHNPRLRPRKCFLSYQLVLVWSTKLR